MQCHLSIEWPRAAKYLQLLWTAAVVVLQLLARFADAPGPNPRGKQNQKDQKES